MIYYDIYYVTYTYIYIYIYMCVCVCVSRVAGLSARPSAAVDETGCARTRTWDLLRAMSQLILRLLNV